MGQSERVEVRISKGSINITTTNNLTTNLMGRGIPTVEPAQVGTFMRVKLTGDNFEINELTDSEQIVDSGSYSQWAWDVTPSESGEQKLGLVVSVRIKVEGAGEETKTYAVKNKAIKVQVNPIYIASRFASNYWQWLVTVIALPVVAWAYKRRPSGKIKSLAVINTENDFIGKLTKYFSIEELKTMAVNLGIDYELVSNAEGGKEAYAREIFLYFKRLGRLSNLVGECKKQRPDVEW